MTKPARPVVTLADLLALARDGMPLPVTDTPDGPLRAIVAPVWVSERGLGSLINRHPKQLREWLRRKGVHIAAPLGRRPVISAEAALDLLGSLWWEPRMIDGVASGVLHAPGCACVEGGDGRCFREQQRRGTAPVRWWAPHLVGARMLLDAARTNEPETLLQHELAAWLHRDAPEYIGTSATKSASPPAPGIVNMLPHRGPNARCWPWEGHVPTLRAFIAGESVDEAALAEWVARRKAIAEREELEAA